MSYRGVSEIALVSALSVLAFVCTVSNLLVCYVIYTKKTTKSLARYYIFSLALTDVLVGTLAIPVHICLPILASDTSERDESVFFGILYNMVHFICQISSIVHLCIMSIDRALAVARPLYHRYTSSRSVVLKLLAIPWFVGALAGTSFVFVPKTASTYMVYFIVLAVLFYVVPIILIVACYSWIFKTIRKRNKAKLARKISEFQLIKTFLIVIVVFMICWTPLNSMIGYDVIKTYISGQNPPLSWEFAILKFINYFGSAVNPFIYAIFQPQFKSAFSEFFNCFNSTRQVEGSEGASGTSGRCSVKENYETVV